MVRKIHFRKLSTINVLLVWIVAPATKQSGQGGRSDFTTEANLTAPSIYNLIPAGAPSVRKLEGLNNVKLMLF